jgi:hypothetical protein
VPGVQIVSLEYTTEEDMKNLLVEIALRLPRPLRTWILYGLVAPDLWPYRNTPIGRMAGHKY